MKLTTKSGSAVEISVAEKTIKLPNCETRSIETVSARHIEFTNGRCEIGVEPANELRAALYGWVKSKNKTLADRYDVIMNEGGEGFNPYRQGSIAQNVEARD